MKALPPAVGLLVLVSIPSAEGRCMSECKAPLSRASVSLAVGCSDDNLEGMEGLAISGQSRGSPSSAPEGHVISAMAAA